MNTGRDEAEALARAVSARFNYCPECKFNLRPSCPQCRREVRLGDRFCPHCAQELTAATTQG